MYTRPGVISSLQTPPSVSCVPEQCLLYVLGAHHRPRIHVLRRRQQQFKILAAKSSQRSREERGPLIFTSSEQEACMPKSLKQLMTHCWISIPSASRVFTVESSRPGLAAQQISIRVSFSLLSTSNYEVDSESVSEVWLQPSTRPANVTYLGGVPHQHLIGVQLLDDAQQIRLLRADLDLLLQVLDPLQELRHVIDGVPENGRPVHLVDADLCQCNLEVE